MQSLDEVEQVQYWLLFVVGVEYLSLAEAVAASNQRTGIKRKERNRGVYAKKGFKRKRTV